MRRVEVRHLLSGISTIKVVESMTCKFKQPIGHCKMTYRVKIINLELRYVR